MDVLWSRRFTGIYLSTKRKSKEIQLNTIVYNNSFFHYSSGSDEFYCLHLVDFLFNETKPENHLMATSIYFTLMSQQLCTIRTMILKKRYWHIYFIIWRFKWNGIYFVCIHTFYFLLSKYIFVTLIFVKGQDCWRFLSKLHKNAACRETCVRYCLK